ncbi:uncharacterized protein LOC135131097 isoform X2 [Zophobas morio]|uniref:uncharacterized protein LOC135131097 isoform X2 n=1 Tax=Zophobas morio TaxID=2755281 RepID=UPI003083A1F0
METLPVQTDPKQPKILQKPPKVDVRNQIVKMSKRNHLNQPQVRPRTLIEQLGIGQSASVGSNRFMKGKYSTTSSGDEYFLDTTAESQSSAFQEMFSMSFRQLKNRNTFAQKVFLILGILMSFSFIVFMLLINQQNITEKFRANWLPLFVAFTAVELLVTFIMFIIPRWTRRPPNYIVLLIFLTVSVTLQAASLVAHFHAIELLLYITGSLMVILFIGSMFSAQDRCEATGWPMFVFFATLTALIATGMTGLLTVVFIEDKKWEYIGAAVGLVLLTMAVILISR